jgi:catechol 2,3-dioxygenase-like lactoylglutathione lyase family enzyme
VIRVRSGYGDRVIRGAHLVVYSSDADADRAFFRDVLEFPFVDAGHGWLIFAAPPAELAVHPAEVAGGQELFFMVDDLGDFVAAMADRGLACSDVTTERWGTVTKLTLPGGGEVGVYQPAHASPLAGGPRS